MKTRITPFNVVHVLLHSGIHKTLVLFSRCICSCKGRVHFALISNINVDNKTVMVEWFERGETKGKEVSRQYFSQCESLLFFAFLVSRIVVSVNFQGHSFIIIVCFWCFFPLVG